MSNWESGLLPALGDMLAARTPYPQEIPPVPDTILNVGALESEIFELEEKLDISLPDSYKQFLLVSNGIELHDLYTEFLPTKKVGWLRDLVPWIVEEPIDDIRSTDEEYFNYGPDQDSITCRDEYLADCLMISSELDGFVFLLNPSVKSNNGEWEAWDYGLKYPGAYRYRSFWELMCKLHSQLENRIT